MVLLASLGTGLVGFLVALLVIAIIFYGVYLLLGMVSIHPNIKTIVWLILLVIAVIFLINRFGGAIGL